MSYDKDEYERLIDASPLFSLDREVERTAYKREALNMVEYLYGYLMAINISKYERYGVEIVDTAKRCIENYRPDAGRFLNYFSSSWKQTYGHLVGRVLVQETFKGIHFTEDEARNFKKYMRLAQSTGVNTETIEFNERVAEAMGINVGEVENLKAMINSRPTSGQYVNEDGEEYSLIDQIDSGNYTEEGIIQFDAVTELIDLLEMTYDQIQDRQKSMMAMLITAKIALLVSEDERLMTVIKQKNFYDEDIFQESLRRGEQIQAKEIAGKIGVAEASISRSWKAFREKLKKENWRD